MLIRQKLFQAQEYFHYLLSQVDEHSLHAPFIFDFYTKVIKAPHKSDLQLTELRHKLQNDQSKVEIMDLGAGSVVESTSHRTISGIAKHSISTLKTARVISRIAASAQPSTIIELGTSLGLLTLHLQHACPEAKIYTIEGAPALSSLAQKHFSLYSGDHIVCINDNIDDALPGLMEQIDQVDVAVLDANHTLQATLSYFYTLLKRCHQGSVVIVDDIHWSREMKEAWDEIRNHPEVTCSIDLYQIGVIFFKEELQKQHWVLTF